VTTTYPTGSRTPVEFYGTPIITSGQFAEWCKSQDRLQQHSFIHSFIFLYVPNLEHRAPFGVSVITRTIRHTVGLLWMSDQPVAEASTYTGQHIIYKHKRQTSMPRTGFEPAISETKRPQTYALDRAASGIGNATTWKTVILNMSKVKEYLMGTCLKICSGILALCILFTCCICWTTTVRKSKQKTDADRNRSLGLILEWKVMMMKRIFMYVHVKIFVRLDMKSN
jgi:hypothetical protein